MATFLYTVSTLHCMTVSLALDGVGLGTMWGRSRRPGMLDEAGFGDIAVERWSPTPSTPTTSRPRAEAGDPWQPDVSATTRW